VTKSSREKGSGYCNITAIKMLLPRIVSALDRRLVKRIQEKNLSTAIILPRRRLPEDNIKYLYGLLRHVPLSSTQKLVKVVHVCSFSNSNCDLVFSLRPTKSKGLIAADKEKNHIVRKNDPRTGKTFLSPSFPDQPG
jgi:hypothetical protein